MYLGHQIPSLVFEYLSMVITFGLGEVFWFWMKNHIDVVNLSELQLASRDDDADEWDDAPELQLSTRFDFDRDPVDQAD